MSGTYGKSDIKRNISKNITLMTISSGGPRPHKTQSNSCDLLNGAPGPIAETSTDSTITPTGNAILNLNY
jgi:hypothetical protein